MEKRLSMALFGSLRELEQVLKIEFTDKQSV